MSDSIPPDKEVWPDHLMIRDTKIVPEDGGGRIYTTVGFGYQKVKYVRGDIHETLRAAIEAISTYRGTAPITRARLRHALAGVDWRKAK